MCNSASAGVYCGESSSGLTLTRNRYSHRRGRIRARPLMLDEVDRCPYTDVVRILVLDGS